jgi:hypothetical protein
MQSQGLYRRGPAIVDAAIRPLAASKSRGGSRCSSARSPLRPQINDRSRLRAHEASVFYFTVLLMRTGYRAPNVNDIGTAMDRRQLEVHREHARAQLSWAIRHGGDPELLDLIRFQTIASRRGSCLWRRRHRHHAHLDPLHGAAFPSIDFRHGFGLLLVASMCPSRHQRIQSRLNHFSYVAIGRCQELSERGVQFFRRKYSPFLDQCFSVWSIQQSSQARL